MRVNLSPELIVLVKAAAEQTKRELEARLVGKRIERNRQPYFCERQNQPAEVVGEVLAVHPPDDHLLDQIGFWPSWTVSVSEQAAAGRQSSRRRLDECVAAEDLHVLFRRCFCGLPVPLSCARAQLYLRSGMPFVDNRIPQFMSASRSVVVSATSPLLLRPRALDRRVPQSWDAVRVEICRDSISFCPDPQASHFGDDVSLYRLADVVPEQSPYLVLKIGRTAIPVLKVRAVRRDLNEVELLPYRDVEAVPLMS